MKESLQMSGNAYSIDYEIEITPSTKQEVANIDNQHSSYDDSGNEDESA